MPFVPRTAIRRYTTTLLFSLSATAASAAPTDLASKLSHVTISNFGQVNANYFRGAQPKGHDYIDLAKLGIKTVIDLTRNGDDTEQGLVETAGMHFHRIPLTTSSKPSDSAVETFLKLVNDPANQPVYVHCQGGRHRTGTMTAIYRMTQDGWTADQAFDEMRKYEFEKGFASHNTLRSFVYDYFTGLQEAHAGQKHGAIAAGGRD